MSGRLLGLVSAVILGWTCSVVHADGDDSDRQRLEQKILELEKRVEELESDDKKSKKTKKSKKSGDDSVFDKAERDEIEDIAKDSYSKGLLTVLGSRLTLGGKLELNFVDTQAERNPAFGPPTDNPDMHLDFDRLRLEPEFDVGRGLSLVGQLDFFADDGDTLLKEATLNHSWRPRGIDGERIWWFRSRAQIGIDDRFNHRGPRARVSETYPLAGTAFWRDEQIGAIWNVTLGHRKGNRRAAPKEIGDDYWMPRDELTNSTTYGAFDFSGNPGALELYASISDGFTLDGKTVTKDDALLQEILQDDREVSTGLSLNEVGLGAGYERDFAWLGEIGLLGFYFTGDLNSESITVLQQEMTLRDGLGNPLQGYGDRTSDSYYRVGGRVTYHFEAFHLFDRHQIYTRPGDGLYLTAEYIESKDGALDRKGWYGQVSWRQSFRKPLLFDYLLRSVEIVGRYGEIKNDDFMALPSLPLTWNRRQFFVGGVIELNDFIFMKAEYAFNGEKTGAGDADNDELLIQLLVNF